MHNLTPLEEARALVVKGDSGAAIDKLGEVLNGDFFNAEALFMLGGLFMQRGMNGVGAVLTSAAIDAREVEGKKYPEAMLNFGGAYKAEGNRDMALRIWLDTLKCEPIATERSKVMTNISALYVNEGCPERAVEWCDRAIALDPHNYFARAQRGMACLELGRWREGWEGWHATYASGDRSKRTYPNIPEWDGSPGKTLIVYGDQGVGDEIFNANIIPDLILHCKKVIFDCHPRLDKLFKRSFPEIEVYGTRKHISHIEWLSGCGADASYCLADLGRFFRNKEADWRGYPYLAAKSCASQEPEIQKLYQSDRLRIGLSWTGGVKRTRTELRSLPIDALVPILAARPDAQFYSLQYTENAAREVCELEERTGHRIAHYPGWVECFDYDRTASFVASMDLIITVCTTVHHLGGALGIPTWTLVPSRPSWRYQLKRETLPWYKSVRLFRQETDGDWAGVIERVAGELKHWGREYADAAC